MFILFSCKEVIYQFLGINFQFLRDKMALDEEAETSPRPNGTEGGENTQERKNDDRAEDERAFECNICLDSAKDAVISMCGHLFWYVPSIKHYFPLLTNWPF